MVASALASAAVPHVHAAENNTIQLALVGCGDIQVSNECAAGAFRLALHTRLYEAGPSIAASGPSP